MVVPNFIPYDVSSALMTSEPSQKGLDWYKGRFDGQEHKPVVIAGPCAIETEDQAVNTATFLSGLGVELFRGQLYKPRTSPDSFQGMGALGVEVLEQVKLDHGMLIVSEVLDEESLEILSGVADILQVGTRNMDNYSLLKLLSTRPEPVLLKRGMSATADEFLQAARYLVGSGKEEVILCERGIRTFTSHARFTLDLAVVPYLKKVCPYPVIVDPSHATGSSELVPPMVFAAIAAGADGVMVEVHPEPNMALSDGEQALDFGQFEGMFTEL